MKISYRRDIFTVYKSKTDRKQRTIAKVSDKWPNYRTKSKYRAENTVSVRHPIIGVAYVEATGKNKSEILKDFHLMQHTSY